MAFAPGTRLGPYEIVGPIGAGGMGEVYKARDTRLERTVAVKVLPPALAGDPDFQARFDREAKSISALNHPHICTLFDVGRLRAGGASASQDEEVDFIVMEFLEGETLADRLKKGPLPVDQALDVAGQIADALDKAHRQGIVHRDLKPANVFLVRAVGASGALHCKLLDFGLAKVGVAAASGTIETRLVTSAGTPMQSPGAAAPLTSQGTILGTFQYMAPEQIEGHDADARTDIWAFGCVLYEMLTGKRAFEGKSQASLIASILERQPAPMAELQPMTPPALGRLVRTCLEKNPDNRFHTAHDLWLHLQWIEEGGSAAGLPAPVVAGRRRRDRVMRAGAAIGLAAVAAAGAWWLKPAPATSIIVTRFTHQLPAGQVFTRTGRRTVAVSPDGTKIAYIANSQIYLRQMQELVAQPIRGTDVDPLDLAFSPDGQSLAFIVPATTGGGFEGATLKKISVTGGAAVPLCPAGPSFGVRWQEGRILFSLGDRILAVPETGGTAEVLVKAADGETLAQPQLADHGKALLYTVRAKRPFDDAQIVVQPTGGARRVLIEGGFDGRVLPTGHLIWMRDNTLYAQAIDLASLQLAGGRVPMVEHVRQAVTSGTGQFQVSDDGTLVFAPDLGGATADLVWVDRAGREESTGAPAQSYTYPRLSPDGTQIVAATTEGDADLWIWDLARKIPRKLTSGPDTDLYPVWTPDNRAIVFRSGPSGGQIDLYRRMADGTGTLERVTETAEAETPQMAFPDGRVLVRITASDIAPRGVISILPSAKGAKPEPVFATLPAAQTSAEISPDGHWIAYQSPEGSLRDEVHVRPFPNTDGGHWQVSSGGGDKPVWDRSGRELYFHGVGAAGSRLMRVDVQPWRAGGPFVYGTPELLFDVTKYTLASIGRNYDVSPDGKRFLLIKPAGADNTTSQSLTIVTGWFDELRARAKGK